MGTFRDTPESYGLVTRSLHWSVAVLMIGNFALGLLGEEENPEIYALHISLGLLTGALILFWIFWRFANPKPRSLSNSPLERGLARGVHLALMLLVLLVVASGVGSVLGEGRPLTFFGVELVTGGPRAQPDIFGGAPPRYGWFEEEEEFEDEYGETESGEFWGELHEFLAQPLFLLLLALHVGGVLKHHLVDRDGTLRRMLGPARGTAT